MTRRFSRLPSSFAANNLYITERVNKAVENIGFYETQATKNLEGVDLLLGDEVAAKKLSNGAIVVLTDHEGFIKTLKQSMVFDGLQKWKAIPPNQQEFLDNLQDLNHRVADLEERLKKIEREAVFYEHLQFEDITLKLFTGHDESFYKMINDNPVLMESMRIYVEGFGRWSMCNDYEIDRCRVDFLVNKLNERKVLIGREKAVITERINKCNEKIEFIESKLKSLKKDYGADFENKTFDIINNMKGVSHIFGTPSSIDIITEDIYLEFAEEDKENLPADIANKKWCFGKFRIQINIRNGTAKAYPHENNQFASDFSHPHIDRGGGGICMGNMHDIYWSYVRERNLIGILETVLMVLQHYGAANPYVYIGRFKAEPQAPSE